jgi:phosphoglycolate phosphatase-like HAD superfamily hydrolase
LFEVPSAIVIYMNNIIFDWSGVVKDTVTSQLWIVNKIFEKYGVDGITLEELKENWEQPYVLFYQKYLPKDYIEEERVKMYREAVFDKNGPKSSAFPGIVDLIKRCKNNGMFLAVASSDFPETLLLEVEEYDLKNAFNEIVTGVSDKLEAVRKIIEDNNLNLQNTFFVGDSNHEIDVAKKVGIKSVAVTWGFTSERKLRDRNPDYVAHNLQELESAIFT